MRPAKKPKATPPVRGALIDQYSTVSTRNSGRTMSSHGGSGSTVRVSATSGAQQQPQRASRRSRLRLPAPVRGTGVGGGGWAAAGAGGGVVLRGRRGAPLGACVAVCGRIGARCRS